MRQITIYKAEKDAGLAEVLRSNASMAYFSRLEPIDPATTLARKFMKALASEHPGLETLFPLKDILVTSGWNLNTDVFDRGELWASRYTPQNHPLNFEHDEKRIIGHITASQAVDEQFNILDDALAVEELPDKYHILNGSVIYRSWQDPEQQQLIDKTIAEIKAGEWYMSMECLFGGFDYGVVGPDGKAKIISRNEDTAFLTKYLRQYGGVGTYKDDKSGMEFKLGRVLRNIAFVGKGLVRKPANPESVIINNVTAFVSSHADLGYIKAEAEVTSTEPETQQMSEPNADLKKLEERVAELANLLSAADKRNETLAAELKAKDGDAAKAEIETRDKKISVLESQVKELTEASSSLVKRAEEAEAAKKAVDAELATLKAEKVEQARLALMTGKGATADKAAELVKKFSNFSDEQFAETVEILSASWKSTTTETKPRKPETVVETVQATTDAPMASPDDTPEEDKVKDRIAKASAYIGKTFLKYNVAQTDKAQD